MKRWSIGVSVLRERLMDLRDARASQVAAAVLLAIYLAVALAGGVDRLEDWYLALGLRRADVFAGKIWQIGTHALLHGAWWHVACNAALLLMLGSRIERMLGPWALLKALACGVAGGAAAHLALVPGEGAASPLVGASGGCVALLLAVTTLSPDSRMFPLPVSAGNLGKGILLAVAFLTLSNPELAIPGLAAAGGWMDAHGWDGGFRVGHACHLGGGLAGWFYARRWLRLPVSLDELRERRRRSEGGC